MLPSSHPSVLCGSGGHTELVSVQGEWNHLIRLSSPAKDPALEHLLKESTLAK